MKAVVLGDTGMLGGMLKRVMEVHGIKVEGISRKDGLLVNPSYCMASLLNKIPALEDADYIVNCIGAIKPVFNDKSRLNEAIYTNACFPHDLVEWNDTFNIGAKIIHITTDCVFDGVDGYYTESSPHNALDNYGKSKSLGESEDCMVLRTSIIGPEWGGNKRSLIEWFLSEKGKTTNGYTNHIWNGLTTLEFSTMICDIMLRDLHSKELYHLYSNDVNKFELLTFINDTLELGIEVSPTEAAQSCNRTLRTRMNLNSLLEPLGMYKMLEQQAKWMAKVSV